MESVASVIKSTLHFISMVQDACDQKRMYVEQKYLQEYSTFLTEWNHNHKVGEKQNQKKETNQKCAKADQNFYDDSLTEVLEELALADSLLEKAKSIRNKSKTFSRPEAYFVNGQSSHTEESGSPCKPNNLQNKMAFNKFEMQSAKQNVAILPHSKSATVSVNYRTSVVPRSKSGSVAVGPKCDENLSTNNKIKCGTVIKKSVVSHIKKHIKSPESSVSVVSKKELSAYKKISVNHSHINEKEKRTGHQNFLSDFSQEGNSVPQPTKRNFLSILKNKLSSKSFLLLPKEGIWYPFISSENKELLFVGIECSTLCSLNKASDLLHRIQEMMLWIDLFYLIGKGILPNLTFLKRSDPNGMRMRSYIMSVFHETFQQIPTLGSNR